MNNPIIVRRVLHHEYSNYEDHLLALDPESKYLRFGHIISEKTIQYMMDKIYVDKDHHILFCVEDENLNFIGVCHIALEERGMELAFSVLKDHQGKGIGNALMRRAIAWCRTNHILTGTMVCLSSNKRIHHLCKKYGMQMDSSQGETVAQFTLENADIGTYLQESTDSNLAVMDWIQKRTNHFYHSAFHNTKSDT
jgi:GNAT superfamily N-acetyltransferase